MNLLDHDCFILLENTKTADEAAWLFHSPVAEVICRDGRELSEAFKTLDNLRQSGHYVAGYVSYEAGYYTVDRQWFDHSTRTQDDILLHMYAFKTAQRLSQDQVQRYFDALECDRARIEGLTFALSEDEYAKKFEVIQQNITDGNTYQINFTTHYDFTVKGHPFALYKQLRQRQKVEYGALLKLPEATILSISPELFFRKKGQWIESKPMKGTFARGKSEAEDQAILQHMRADEKTLSENVMIVDLIRNDMSRITVPGTVSVNRLFEIQSYETVHQMISTVTGQVDTDISITEIFTNLFPCGSITGAPKIRTMEIIEQIEDAPRGIYTGAIGYITPDNDMCFNVPIRTCVIDEDGQARLGVGGGIIADSVCREEYQECLLKARFLTGMTPNVQLIESMRLMHQTASIARLEMHLTRLANSMADLGFTGQLSDIQAALADVVAQPLTEDQKIRLVVDQKGTFELTHSPIIEHQAPLEIIISDVTVDSKHPLFPHKTTERTLYHKAYEAAKQHDCYDALLINERGEITEGSFHNVFIEKNGHWYTPPVTSGIVEGVMRQAWLQALGNACTEKPLYPQDIQTADRIVLTNSVRGCVDVRLKV
ncbi:aminodeoxychorismate synthase component I [Wohlfahrtiimonas chitiniclastica]|uniref:aminodeoxychorismate synthase component I n=1 Tax=Wohlfahrtiimonas chitiniclastica TaxID=400946 RepID=UPI001BCFF640|nr:aminodeoxychorismate synthase component I [Wohlfahrtiimonas chitiniclastica]MBS7834811.1 aminodeoxychorismate synthase component I [Wohlfahrtiimonas chitiniclastica]